MIGKPPPGLVERYSRQIKARNGKSVMLRPILPEDTKREFEMFSRFSETSSYYRFFGIKRVEKPKDVWEFTHIDYDKDMAIIALFEDKEIGVGRICGYGEKAEFAIIIEDDWQGEGVGSEVTKLIIQVAKDMGFKSLFGEILTENKKGISFLESMGFRLERRCGEDCYRFGKKL